MQYYTAMQYPSNHNVVKLDAVCSNSELIGILCEKRHDAVVVIDNKHFITRVSVHILVIAS